MDGVVSGWMDGWMDGWMRMDGGWMDEMDEEMEWVDEDGVGGWSE